MYPNKFEFLCMVNLRHVSKHCDTFAHALSNMLVLFMFTVSVPLSVVLDLIAVTCIHCVVYLSMLRMQVNKPAVLLLIPNINLHKRPQLCVNLMSYIVIALSARSS